MTMTRAMVAAQAANNDKSARVKSNKQPPRKRTKTKGQATSRTKKVSLSRVLDMPLEVFNEITTYLLPMDLLSLARANKFFRGMLMSRASQHLWKGALENLPDLPLCPPHLSEPKYVSLLFSKTCSSCGTRVLRRMDAYLYVRLCNLCRDEELMEVPLFHPLLPYLLKSDVTSNPARAGYVYTLPSEFSQISDAAEQTGEDFQNWQDSRFIELNERMGRSAALADYLDILEDEREMELEGLKLKRQDEIETRLLKKGWTKRDMEASPSNSAEWQKLVWQPKPITDRIWANLYPKLQPLLNSNRTWNDQVDKTNRRRARIKKLQELVDTIRFALPPLARLTLKSTPEGNNTAGSSTIPIHPSLSSHYPYIRIDQPFPSMAELLTWPMIKSIVDDDTSPEHARTGFEDIRGKFDRAVVEWREKIEQDLVEIWNAGRDAAEESEQQSKPSKRKGKGKAIAPTTKTNSRESIRSATTDESAADSVKFNFPEFVATFTKSDGTTTTNISDLSPNLQLLLRADAVFKPTGYVFDHTYPNIVPRAAPIGFIFGGPNELTYGERWDASVIQRDDETVAQVYHYATEQGRWKQAQETIKAEPRSGFVFNSTHDLEPGDLKPFARFLTPQAASDYVMDNSEHITVMTRCMRCHTMGIQAQYFHIFDPGFESPMKEHLNDVHGVTEVRAGIDFQRCENDVQFFDPFESDEEDHHSDDTTWGILD